MSRKRAAGPATGTPNARQRAAAAAQVAQRKRDRRILAIVAIGIAVVLIAGGIGIQAWRTSRTPTVGSSSAPTSAPVTLQSGQPAVFGSASAPVTLTLYEDFHCPACEAFQKAYGGVLTEAENAGTLKVEFYPLQFHDQGSPPAANGFACAAQAGFGPAYYEGLFANFTLQWSDSQLLSLADQITGSTPDTFRTCVTTKANQAWVDSITQAADRNGVTGTPTVLLNGQPVDLGQVTPDALRTRIAEAAAR